MLDLKNKKIMSEKQIKQLNALRAKHKLTEQEEELLQELEMEYVEREDIMTEFLSQIED